MVTMIMVVFWLGRDERKAVVEPTSGRFEMATRSNSNEKQRHLLISLTSCGQRDIIVPRMETSLAQIDFQ
jgi:hypothetical protein